jgi:translation elongation factor EF-1beta
MEVNVRKIEKDGLVWGSSQLVPVGFGIKKLRITAVVEDEKVSVDELQQQIEEDEEHVQSTDIVSFTRHSFLVISNFNLRLQCKSCKSRDMLKRLWLPSGLCQISHREAQLIIFLFLTLLPIFCHIRAY